MNLFKSFLGLFKTAGTDAVTATIQEANSLVDKLFTSDKERLQWVQTMEKINQASQSAVARTARGALVWAIAINLMYVGFGCDLLRALGLNLPVPAIGYDVLLKNVMVLLTGGAG